MGRSVTLSSDQTTLVSNKDYVWVMQWKWSALKARHGWYAVRREGRKYIYLHRALMDAPKGRQVDHKNGDGLDNRRANLRVATNMQNSRNRHRRNGVLSQYRGVTKRKKAWIAQITVNYHNHYVGSFKTEAEAAQAYNAAAKKAFGKYASLNEVSCGA